MCLQTYEELQGASKRLSSQCHALLGDYLPKGCIASRSNGARLGSLHLRLATLFGVIVAGFRCNQCDTTSILTPPHVTRNGAGGRGESPNGALSLHPATHEGK